MDGAKKLLEGLKVFACYDDKDGRIAQAFDYAIECISIVEGLPNEAEILQVIDNVWTENMEYETLGEWKVRSAKAIAQRIGGEE